MRGQNRRGETPDEGAAGRVLLPLSRAFIVQLHADADATPEQLHGRIEHVRSGEAEHFESLQALLEFIGARLCEVTPGKQ